MLFYVLLVIPVAVTIIAGALAWERRTQRVTPTLPLPIDRVDRGGLDPDADD